MLSTIENYGGEKASAEVAPNPTTMQELVALVNSARTAGRRITFRGGNHAYGNQSLGRDLIVSLKELKSVTVNATARTAIVEGGARWEDVFDECRKAELIPYIMVTSGDTTVGGTMSSDSLSRFSPSWGKESLYVHWFDLLRPDGQLIRCSKTTNARLFRTALAGFGLLGAIVRAEIALLPLEARSSVHTIVHPHRGFPSLVTQLYDRAQRVATRPPSTQLSPGDVTVFAVLYANSKVPRGMVLRSRYSTKKVGFFWNRLPIHQPYTFYRPLVELCMRSRLGTLVVWKMAFWVLYTRRRSFVDDVKGFTFCMEGNSRAHHLGKKLGLAMKAVQQTFMIPVTSDRSQSIKRTVSFLERLETDLKRENIVPQLFDVLFIRRGDDTILSSSRALGQPQAASYFGSFAVSVLLDTSDEDVLLRGKHLFRQWSAWCNSLGGRVHLVKSVHADTSDLRAMYGRQIRSFMHAKSKADPQGTLSSDFCDLLKSAR